MPAGPSRASAPYAGSVGVVSAQDLRSAFDNAPIGMAVLTPLGVITGCNAQVGVLLQRHPHELVGRTFFDVTHPDDLEGAHAACLQVRDGELPVVRHDVRFLLPDGNHLWVSVSTSMVPEADGRPAHLIMHLLDIGERKELESVLRHQALHDPLTGLANRSLLMDRAEQARGRAVRAGASTTILLLDLDGFKAVNDTHGHLVGDVVLQQVAQRVQSVLRTADTAARLGGDEFVVLCEDLPEEQASLLAARLGAVVAEPYLVQGRCITLTAAVGWSTCQAGDQDALLLLREADRRMYAAKGRRP